MAVNNGRRAPAVRRTVAVLDLLSRSGQASASEISAELMLPKSSTADLVATMHESGLLARRGDDYVAGELITGLAAGFTGDAAMLERFAADWGKHPVLHEHTVALYALLGTRAMCVDTRLGTHVLPATPRAGRVISLWHDDNGDGSPFLRLIPRPALVRTLSQFEGFGHTTEEGAAALEWWDRVGDTRPFAINDTDPHGLSVGVLVPTTRTEGPPVVLAAHLLREHNDQVREIHQALHDLAVLITTPPGPAPKKGHTE